jgi:hypothetical protein
MTASTESKFVVLGRLSKMPVEERVARYDEMAALKAGGLSLRALAALISERDGVSMSGERVRQILKAGRPIAKGDHLSDRDRKIKDLTERIERWSDRPPTARSQLRADRYRQELRSLSHA